MSLPALDNLVGIGQLKAEPRNEVEVRRLLAMARTRLADAQFAGLLPRGVSSVPTMLPMQLPWRPFVGMATVAKTATRYFNA